MLRLITGMKGLLLGAGKHKLEELGVRELLTLDDWRACLEASAEGPVFVFKHSTTCPISAAAHREVGRYLEQAASAVSLFHLVKVIESRPVSNAIATELGITHQSPQIILVKNRHALWSASHGAVRAGAIADAFAAAASPPPSP